MTFLFSALNNHFPSKKRAPMGKSTGANAYFMRFSNVAALRAVR